ncbi:MAG TPA: hypothetical protein VNX68_16260 [Nitrosopumilaceae archaeon]|jgi:hypothetical protein|nr:hypothetical protein [Nitrosopumilaceae archaeon]
MLQVKRHIYDTPLNKGQTLYPLQPFMKKVVSIRVNDIDFPIRIHKLINGRFLDLAPFFKKYPTVETGTITIYVNEGGESWKKKNTKNS